MAEALIRIDIDRQHKRVTATRTGATVATAAAVQAMVGEARTALATVARAEYAIVIDLRAAPLAVETTFAAAFVSLRRELTSGFRRTLFLVATKVGGRKVPRFIREERLAAIVVDNPDEVQRHLG